MALVAGALLVMPGAASAAVTPVTESTTLIDTSHAKLHGTVHITGGSKADYLFGYGTSSDPGQMIYTSPKETTGATVAVSAKISHLEPKTTYYYTLATRDLATKQFAYSKILSFATLGYHSTQFLSREYSANLKNTKAAPFTLKVPHGGEGEEVMTCSSADLLGQILAGSSSPAFTPTFVECTSPSLGPITVVPNSCKLVFNVANTAPSYTGSLSISCTKEGDMIAFNTNWGCNFKIGQQSPGGSLAYTNQGSGTSSTVRAQGSVTGVKWTSNYICQTVGFAASGETAVITADSTIQATHSFSNVEFYVSGGENEVAVSMSGGEFKAAQTPARATGVKQGTIILDPLEGGAVTECSAVMFTGTDSLPAKAISVSPSSTTCVSPFGGGTLTPKSCKFVLNAGGSVGISCVKEGDTMAFSTAGCTFRLAPQTPSGALSYQNRGGEGALGWVDAQGTLTGIKWAANFICTLGGVPLSGESGALEIDAEVGGIYTG